LAALTMMGFHIDLLKKQEPSVRDQGTLAYS
jgi:hypothetical protein